MSDFRIPVSSNDSDWDYELDWDESDSRWTLSVRESGLGTAWQMDLSLEPHHYDVLRSFFAVADAELDGHSLESLNPAELTLISHNHKKNSSVHAMLCKKCGKHWLIFRRNRPNSDWVVFGRDCDYSWRRENTPTEEEVAELLSALQYSNSKG